MQVQVSTDNNINGSAKLIENIATELQDTLARFGNQITRVDVHCATTTARNPPVTTRVACSRPGSPAGNRRS